MQNSWRTGICLVAPLPSSSNRMRSRIANVRVHPAPDTGRAKGCELRVVQLADRPRGAAVMRTDVDTSMTYAAPWQHYCGSLHAVTAARRCRAVVCHESFEFDVWACSFQTASRVIEIQRAGVCV